MPRDSTLDEPDRPTAGPRHEVDDAGARSGGEDTRTDEDLGERAGAQERRSLERRRGEMLGRYVLLDLIGRGGMGVVYSAYDPELDRRVALKLLRSPDDEHGHARLAREAQAMAKLAHPNVIAVHDVGRFDRGVFVAMELVDGVDLREWMDRPHPVSEIVSVFIAAGRGLLAAHRVGLVHRDFKPANALVGRGGEVKVVDFGLARLLDGGMDTGEVRAVERRLDVGGPSSVSLGTDVTRTGAVLGTPAYMAPEQHLRRSVDARTDQFAFCVALYEALYGQRPFSGSSRVALAVQTNRGEIEPPPRGRPVPAPIHRALVRGLSPEPADRFASMAELLDALHHDPARRRRRVLAGASAAVLLGVGLYGYVRPSDEAAPPPPCPRDRSAFEGVWDDAQRDRLRDAFAASPLPYAAETARFVTGRLDAWTEGWLDARVDACEATHVAHTQPEAQLTLRRDCLDRQRKDLTAATRQLLDADAKTIERAARIVGALPTPDACADTEALGRLPPPADPETRAAVEAVHTQLSEVATLEAAGRFPRALERAEAAHAAALATGYGPVIAEALHTLGGQQGRNGHNVEANATLHAAAHAATEARHDDALARAWTSLSWSLGIGNSKHEEGLRWLAYAEAVINRMGRPERLLDELLCTRGILRWAAGQSDGALADIRGCLEIRERIRPGDPRLANTLSYLGNTLIQLGRYDEAEAAFERGRRIAHAAHGPRHPLVASMHNGLGVVYYHQNRLSAAEGEYQRAYEINRELLGPDHLDLMYSLGNIAGCRRDRGQYESALEAMRRVQALVERGFPPEHREVGTTLHNIGELLGLLGRHEEAIEHFDRALPIRVAVHGEGDPYVANTLTARGESRLALGRDSRARRDFERALEIRDAASDHRRHDYGRTRFGLARALWRTGGDRDRALELSRAAAADFEPAEGALKQERRDALEAWIRERAGPSPR